MNRQRRISIVLFVAVVGLVTPITSATAAPPPRSSTPVTVVETPTVTDCSTIRCVPAEPGAPTAEAGFVAAAVSEPDAGLALTPSNPNWSKTTSLSYRSLQMSYSTGYVQWGVQPRSAAARSATTLGNAAGNLRRNGNLACTFSKKTQYPTYHYHSSCGGFSRGDRVELNFGVSWTVVSTSYLYTTQILFTV